MSGKRSFFSNLFGRGKQERQSESNLRRPYSPLKEQCRIHIENMVRFFANQGAPYLDFAAEHWQGLLADGIWNQTEQLANELHNQAVAVRRVCSERFSEQGQFGRMVLVSVAPSRGDDHMLRSFPCGDYGEFLREERRKFREIPNWADRDFVHWMFLWDDGRLDIHLLYLWSVNLRLMVIAQQFERAERDAQGRAKVRMPPVIMPEDLITRPEWFSLSESLFREEVSLLR